MGLLPVSLLAATDSTGAPPAASLRKRVSLISRPWQKEVLGSQVRGRHLPAGYCAALGVVATLSACGGGTEASSTSRLVMV